MTAPLNLAAWRAEAEAKRDANALHMLPKVALVTYLKDHAGHAVILLDAIGRVLDLHNVVESGGHSYCASCQAPAPCQTRRRALGVEADPNG